MPFFDNANFVIFHGEFEKGDLVARYELRRYRAATQSRVFFSAAAYVLRRLHDRYLIVSALGLNRNHEVTTVLVHPYIKLVYFNLTYAFDRSPEVVLQRISREAQEDIDEAVITDLGQQGLFIVEGVGGNNFGGAIRNSYARKGNVMNDAIGLAKAKTILRPAHQFDEPLIAFGLGSPRFQCNNWRYAKRALARGCNGRSLISLDFLFTFQSDFMTLRLAAFRDIDAPKALTDL